MEASWLPGQIWHRVKLRWHRSPPRAFRERCGTLWWSTSCASTSSSGLGVFFFFFGESHGPRGVFRSHHWMVKNSLKDLRFFFRGPHINLFGGLELHSCLFVAWTFDGWCFWFFGITCWEQGHMLDCKLLQFIFMLHHCGTFWKCAWAIAFDIVHRVYAYASWINTYCSTQYLLQIRHKFGLLFVHPQL